MNSSFFAMTPFNIIVLCNDFMFYSYLIFLFIFIHDKFCLIAVSCVVILCLVLELVHIYVQGCHVYMFCLVYFVTFDCVVRTLILKKILISNEFKQ